MNWNLEKKDGLLQIDAPIYQKRMAAAAAKDWTQPCFKSKSYIDRSQLSAAHFSAHAVCASATSLSLSLFNQFFI